MSPILRGTACVCIILLLAAPAALLQEPDITYTTVTSVKFGGAAGRAVNFLARLGGGSTEISETVYLKGNRMLRQSDESSTLLDLDAEQMTTLDHKAKTYSVITFEELRRHVEEMTRQAADNTTGQETEPAPSETDVSFDLQVDPTGQQRSINGHSARQYFVTISIEGTATDEESGETESGTLVVASELWLSEDLAHEEMDAFNRTFAERFGDVVLGASGTQNLAGAMQQAFAGDQRIQEGLAQAEAEAAKMKGIEVLSTTHIVLLAEGATFNRDLAFNAAPEEPEQRGGLLGRARRMAQQSAGNETAEPATQQVLLTTTSEMQEYSNNPINSSVFEVPAGYTPVAYGTD